jgi:hypothetical protein
MRRAAIPLVLLLALTACSTSLKGAAAPIAQEEVGAGLGLDVAAARQAAIDFLTAYAHATEDRGERLAALVTGPKLSAWVRWLNVQNQQFDGTIAGTIVLHSVAFVDTFIVQNVAGAQVNMGASVTFTYVPANAASFDLTRILDGPLTLLETGPAQWKVFDVTRDGQSMDAGIQLFRDLSQTRHGVTVQLDSLFMFTPNWQFNVVVRNRSGREVRLAGKDLSLDVHAQGGGRQHVRGVWSSELETIANGADSKGLVAFHQQREATGRTLAIAYRTAGGRKVRFEFPLGSVISQVPPIAGASPSPTPTS